MKSTLNNQLAQVCNNLHSIMIQAIKGQLDVPNKKLHSLYFELQAEYNTLFKLIYGDK